MTGRQAPEPLVGGAERRTPVRVQVKAERCGDHLTAHRSQVPIRWKFQPDQYTNVARPLIAFSSAKPQ